MPVDSCPDMIFKRVLRPWFSFGRFTNLSVARASVLFQGDGAFITEDYVVKRIATLQNSLHVLEPFRLVGLPDQLAVSGALQRPSLLISRSSHSGGVDHDTTLGQSLLYLDASRLIVLSHLVFYESFRLKRKLCRSSRLLKVLDGASLLKFSYNSGNAGEASL